MNNIFRYLRRDKIFSFINIVGLTIGLTATLYIANYILKETNYDNFHENGNYIYRVSAEMFEEGHSWGDDYVSVPPIGPALKSQVAGIESYTRVSYTSRRVQNGDTYFNVENMLFADTSFFSMFTFPLSKGDPKTALTVPYSIVLSEKLATKFFENNDPIGQTLLVDGAYYTVTAIAQNPPQNSDLTFEAVLSFSTLYRMENRYMGWDGGNQYITYVQLYPQADLETVTNQSAAILYERLGKDYEAAFDITFRTHLRPLKKLHLYYNYESSFLQIGLLVLLAIAVLIITIAAINFVNLTAARSLKRLKESGVRKVLGAKRSNLVRLFLGESLLVSLLSFATSLLLFSLLEPLYTRLSNNYINFSEHTTVAAIVVVFLLSLLIGVIGGSYPAFRISSISLADAAKGGGTQKRQRHIVQNVLIVLQLTISIVLLTATIFISRQLAYAGNKDVGFNREQILVLEMKTKEESKNIFLLKERLKEIPEIRSVSASSDVLADGLTQNGYRLEGKDNVLLIRVLDVDADFFEVYNIPLKSGRLFSDNRQTDKQTYLVNEKLAALFEDDAIGKYIERGGRYEIIGIVKNFHYASLYDEIAPLIITFDPEMGYYSALSIRFEVNNVREMLKKVEKTWREINPNSPFEFRFFDEIYEAQYTLERHFRSMFLCFGVIAILLAALGMLSLMVYTTEQRKKEIGIRKVLGASVSEIMKLLLRRTLWQIVIANLIAIPISLYLVQMWLNNFAYRISIGWAVFALVFFLSAVVVLLVVSLQTIKAALENPVDSIKTE